jgi:hypothetical protein
VFADELNMAFNPAHALTLGLLRGMQMLEIEE